MVSCKEYVYIRKEALKEKIKTFEKPPKLCVIQVGNNPASNTYVKGKRKDSEEVGIEFVHVQLPETITQTELEDVIVYHETIKPVDGIIVQLPLPEHLDEKRIKKIIDPTFDVDGFNVISSFDPCTPKGIIDWLEYNGVDLRGKTCTVVGRSDIVGKPLVNMMIERGATVINCNSKTDPYDIIDFFGMSDIIVSAIGRPNHWTLPDLLKIKKPVIIVDVGINRDENGKLCGDFSNKDSWSCKTYIEDSFENSYVTPVPGGVGLLTRLALIENVVASYESKQDF